MIDFAGDHNGIFGALFDCRKGLFFLPALYISLVNETEFKHLPEGR
jgi:hypothetical protein